MSRLLTSRAATAALLSLLLVGTGASTASARPDPGDVGSPGDTTSGQNCPLRRIDTQLVRCDNLTGAGVSAPLFILELGPLASSGAR